MYYNYHTQQQKGDDSMHRLYKSRKNKVIDGVCGGIGEYFGIDPVIIRLLWVGLFFAYGSGIILYIVGMIIIPPAPIRDDFDDKEKEFKEEYKTYSSNRERINTPDKRIISIIAALFLIFIGLSLMINLLTPINFFAMTWKILVSLVLIFIGGAMVYGFIKENKK